MGRTHLERARAGGWADRGSDRRAGGGDARFAGRSGSSRVCHRRRRCSHDGGIDAVLIAAPSDLHLSLVQTFAAARVPMLCEKPVGVSATEAIEAAAVVRKPGSCSRSAIGGGSCPNCASFGSGSRPVELGEISRSPACSGMPSRRRPQFRAHSGGIAVDMGVHEFDQTRWLLGQDMAWVSAARGRAVREARAADPDAAVMLAQLAGGAAATVSLGRRFPHARLVLDRGVRDAPATSGCRSCGRTAGRARDSRPRCVAQAEAFAPACGAAARGGARAPRTRSPR